MRSTVLNTPTKLLPRKANLQQGQAIVLIAVLILVLFGMLGLAIDSGRGYVDRREQQTAVDASALNAGDWYENTSDLSLSITRSVSLYQQNLRIYSGIQTSSQLTAYVGPTGSLRQDTFTYTFAGSYTLTVVATDTQFNGYQFVYTTNHNLPLAFMQIFGGGLTIPISATATSVVGNQRQTPALLTLSTDRCSTNLTGSAQLTVLGDVYSNGTACLDANLHEAGNCYGAAGTPSSTATTTAPGSFPTHPRADSVTSWAQVSCPRQRFPTRASLPRRSGTTRMRRPTTSTTAARGPRCIPARTATSTSAVAQQAAPSSMPAFTRGPTTTAQTPQEASYPMS